GIAEPQCEIAEQANPKRLSLIHPRAPALAGSVECLECVRDHLAWQRNRQWRVQGARATNRFRSCASTLENTRSRLTRAPAPLLWTRCSVRRTPTSLSQGAGR